MTAALDWEQTNREYLGAGLQWLRQTLDSARTGRAANATDGANETPTTSHETVVPSGSADAWWNETRFTATDLPPALELLALRLELSRFETLVLLLCVSMELDPGTGSRCAAALGGGPSAPSFALAMATLPEPSWDAISPYGHLRHWRLVHLEPAPDGALTRSALRADERIVNYVVGLNDLDERLTRWLRPLADTLGKDLAPTHQRAVHQLTDTWNSPATGGPDAVVELIGADERIRRGVAAAAAMDLGITIYEVSATALPTDPGDLNDLARLLNREARLLPLAYYVDCADLTPDVEALVRGLSVDVDARLVLGGYEPFPLPRRHTRLIDARRASVVEQKQQWRELLGPESDHHAAHLAEHFDLDPGTIRELARQRSDPFDDAAAAGLWDLCRDNSRPRMTSLAQRIEPVAGWDDLVLAEPERQALQRLADQVRGRPTVLREWGLQGDRARGGGIVALFAGQSGTGKTLAAEVLAHDLRLSLYRIDLSGVVSKYIGETERNLRRVFDAAEQGGALLFFDEADALFGKRSEVRDSHDRYANIEVNYLLQRLEDFRGVAVLATNQRQALDSAFLRRLRTVITFGFPSTPQRRQLWTKAFPSTAPTKALDLDRLSELPATGGMIRNIALNAACCAAGQGGVIDMGLVLAMAQVEFRKVDLPLPDSHFLPSEVS